MENWKDFIKNDPRIIRPMDGYECVLIYSYLSATDIFPKFDVDKFINNFNLNVPGMDIFNLGVKLIDNHPFWIKYPLILEKGYNLIIKEDLKKEEESYINYLKKDEEILPSNFEAILDKNDPSIKIPFRMEITKMNSNEVKFTLFAFHVMCDGRTIFNILELIKRIINGETGIKSKAELCEFGQLKSYQNLDESVYKDPPELWKKIPKLKILPKLITPEPFNKNYIFTYFNPHYFYPYPKIKQFCKENNVSVQAMLTTVMSRTTRKFYNFPLSTEIYNYTPCDSRNSPFATKYLKEREFFCGAGSLFPCSIGQKDVISDIKYNYERLKESIKGLGNISQILRSGMCVNYNDLSYKPPEYMPSFNEQPVTVCSNVGKVKGKIPILGIWMNGRKVGDFGDNYIVGFHCISNDDYLVISCIRPKEIDPNYKKAFEEEMDLIFNINF